MQIDSRIVRYFAGLLAVAFIVGCSRFESDADARVLSEIDETTFGCISELTPVGRFYVGNLLGGLDETVAVAQSSTGGAFPAGSVVQLIPTEVMIKRETGFSDETDDWEFFELDVSAQSTSIRTRGHANVTNRFGNNCLECHEKAHDEWDMICSTDHGCDPIPLSEDMIRALQKTDPRCSPVELTEAETQALELLPELLGAVSNSSQ